MGSGARVEQADRADQCRVGVCQELNFGLQFLLPLDTLRTAVGADGIDRGPCVFPRLRGFSKTLEFPLTDESPRPAEENHDGGSVGENRVERDGLARSTCQGKWGHLRAHAEGRGVARNGDHGRHGKAVQPRQEERRNAHRHGPTSSPRDHVRHDQEGTHGCQWKRDRRVGAHERVAEAREEDRGPRQQEEEACGREERA